MDLDGLPTDPKLHSKWKAFRDDVQSVLKAFDTAKEWPDVIKCVNKLQKALENKKYEKFTAVPEKLTVCKRLAQCLNPSLPTGVHVTTLDLYRLIFQKIGPNLAADLPLYSMGLFPLFQSASLQVRPKLLELYNEFYLPLGLELAPCVDGFVASLLPGLEEENTKIYSSTEALLDALRNCLISEEALFFKAVWKAVYINPAVRISGFSFLTSRLPSCSPPSQPTRSGVTSIMLGHSPTLAWAAIAASISDVNDRVRRAALDCLLSCFRLHEKGLMSDRDRVHIMVAGLRILALKEQPALRRLFNWLYGGDTENAEYFDKYTKHIMVPALQALFQDGVRAQPKSDPFYILMFLLSGRARAENPFHQLLPEIMWDVLCAIAKDCAAAPHRNHRMFTELPHDIIFNSLRTKVDHLLLGSEHAKDHESLQMVCQIAEVLPLHVGGPDVFGPHGQQAHDAVDSLHSADNDSDSSSDSPSGLQNDGVFHCDDSYGSCVARLMFLVLGRASRICHTVGVEVEHKLLVVSKLLRLTTGLYTLLASALEPPSPLSADQTSQSLACAAHTISHLVTLACQVLPAVLPVCHATSLDSPCMVETLTEICGSLELFLGQRQRYFLVLPSELKPHDDLAEAETLPQWLTLLAGDALEKASAPVILVVGRTILHLLQQDLLPNGLSRKLLDSTDLLVAKLWDLLAAEHNCHHEEVVTLLCALRRLRPVAVEKQVATWLVDCCGPVVPNLSSYQKFATLWHMMDQLSLDAGAFASPVCLLVDALKSEDPHFRALAVRWLGRAAENIARLVQPFFGVLVDEEWDREGERMMLQPLDHRRTYYALTSLQNMLECAPRQFLSAAFNTPGGHALWARNVMNALVQAAKRDGRLLTGCPVPPHNYFAILASALLTMVEGQIPPFPTDSSTAHLYMTYRNSLATFTLKEGVVLDPDNLAASIAVIVDTVAQKWASETDPPTHSQMLLAIQALRCLQLMFRYTHIHLGGTDITASLTGVAATLLPAVCLLLNCSVLMEAPLLQMELLQLISILLSQLNNITSFSTKDSGSALSAAHLAAIAPSPVFLYPLLHGLAWAGLRGSSDTFRYWIDVLSCMVPLTHNAMAKMTQGLVHIYCHVARHAVHATHFPNPGDTLLCAFRGLQNIITCLFSDEPLEMKSVGQRLMWLTIPPGRMFDEILGSLTMVRPANLDTSVGSDSPSANGIGSPLIRDVNIVASREAFHSLLEHVITTLSDLHTTLKPLTQNSSPWNVNSTLFVALGQATQLVLDPLMCTQPLVLLRGMIRLLGDRCPSPFSEFSSIAGVFIDLLNFLPAATTDAVVLAMLHVVQENASPAAQAATTSRLALLGSEKPTPPITFGFTLELMALAFLTEYIARGAKQDDLGLVRMLVFSVIRDLCGGTNGFTPSFAMRFAMQFATQCSTYSAGAADDAKFKKLLAECVNRLIEGAVKMSLGVEPPCADPLALDSPIELDPSAWALTNFNTVLHEGQQGALLRILEREDRDKVGPLLQGLLATQIAPVLRLKDDACRARSTLRIRAAVEFIAVCLQTFPQCVRLLRRDLWEFVHDSAFFKVDRLTMVHWKNAFALTVASDTGWHYQDLVARFAAALGTIFTGTDTVAKERAQLIRRLSFTMLSAPPDGAQLSVQILDMLLEAVKLGAASLTQQAFLCFRVLLFKVSPQNLAIFWPTILHEMIRVLNKFTSQPREVVFEALKAADLACIVLPSHFQLFKWIFIRETPQPTSIVDRASYQALISAQTGNKLSAGSSNAMLAKCLDARTPGLNAPMLSVPERRYADIQSLEVVAAAVCNTSLFEPHIPYQADVGAEGSLWDSSTLQPSNQGRKVSPQDIEWVLLGDLYEWTFFKF